MSVSGYLEVAHCFVLIQVLIFMPLAVEKREALSQVSEIIKVVLQLLLKHDHVLVALLSVHSTQLLIPT